jgi:hypothetical protein
VSLSSSFVLRGRTTNNKESDMRLQLWIATQENDSECYNLVSTTKKNLIEQMNEHNPLDYKAVAKVEIRAASSFEFFELVTGEGGGRAPEAYDIRDWYTVRIVDGKVEGLNVSIEVPTGPQVIEPISAKELVDEALNSDGSPAPGRVRHY